MRKILQAIYRIKLFKRVVPSLLKIYINLTKTTEIVIQNNKVFFNLNLMNPIDKEIYLKGDYEKEQIDFLLDEIEKRNIKNFIDIGAHMGFYSINISKKNIKTYSFEPYKKNFEQLKKNIELNKVDNIDIYNLALSNEKKMIKMWVPDKNKTGGFSVYDKNDEERKKYDKKNIYEIEGKSDIGDTFIKLENEKIAIKIDVERHEKKVLEGINKLLKKNKIIIQIELFEERKKDIFKILNQYNYNYFRKIQKDYYFKNF